MSATEMGLLLAGLATAAVVAALGASGVRQAPGECEDCGAGLSGDERVAGLCDDCSWGSGQW